MEEKSKVWNSLLVISLLLIMVTSDCKKESDTKEQLFTADQPIEDIEGNVYKTVEIGTQVWMAENLKTTKYADATPVPLVTSNSDWHALVYTSKAYCWFNNYIINKDPYGALYTWAAATDGALSSNTNPSGVQGACPTGWHLPSDTEWEELTTYLGGSEIAGGKMKEAGLTHWGGKRSSPIVNNGATNESGFTGLPAECRGDDGSFSGDLSYMGFWWSSTGWGEPFTNGYYRNLGWIVATIYKGNYPKTFGLSVRCVKD
jgi:uncharacterized protein (TIGR02145 family)